MSDETPARRVPMIAATSMLRPPPARIGKISDNIVLPRAVEAKKLFAGIGGMLITVFLWLVLWGPIIGFSFLSFLFAAAIGVALGLAFVTLSPIRGESMFTFLQLNLQSRRGDWVELDGKPSKAFIGIAPLPYRAAGRTRVQAGAVEVVPGTVDERGVPVRREERTHAAVVASGVAPLPPQQQEGFAEVKPLGSKSILEERPHRTPPRQPATYAPPPPPPAVPANGENY